jgi:hypothetical protein
MAIFVSALVVEQKYAHLLVTETFNGKTQGVRCYEHIGVSQENQVPVHVRDEHIQNGRLAQSFHDSVQLHASAGERPHYLIRTVGHRVSPDDYLQPVNGIVKREAVPDLVGDAQFFVPSCDDDGYARRITGTNGRWFRPL